MDTQLADLLAGPVLDVAPRLLGAVVTHAGVSVRLTEVEAYDGEDDPGSHAFRGPTRRNEVMFGPAGHLYVYFTYGMHHCANVVCGPAGRASAVLMRAGEVVDGTELARRRRGRSSARDLARGPARLCQALGLELDHNGSFLLAEDAAPRLSLPARGDPGERGSPSPVSTGPRVGLRHAADRPWRFWLTDDVHVSDYRPAAPLRRRPR